MASRKLNQAQINATGIAKLHQLPSWLSWQAWAILLVIVSGSVGFVATTLLLKLPKSPNCPRIFWPVASGSLRLYCAQQEADKRTVESLLSAIALVEALPASHPLRAEVDRQVEDWASEVLDLAEKRFQAGELDEAVKIASQIPSQAKAYHLVEDRIESWRSTWSESVGIYAQIERQLRLANWNEAFRWAVKLTHVDNRYWATTKYTEAVDQIRMAREDSSKLDSAFAVLRRGGIDNLFAAVEQADKISQKSYAFKEAQDLIAQAKNELLKHVEQLVDDRRWQELLQIANRIPEGLSLQKQVEDWTQLADAGTTADLGTIEGLQMAIAEAKDIDSISSVHYEAQQLVEHWQLEIEDIRYLEKARELAQPGGVNALLAGISEAELIPRFNPRYQEAQATIRDWRRQIETIEDQPFLDQARSLALGGDVPDLQAAINQAQIIAPNRALYEEAQTQIGEWQVSIEQQQDQPILDHATAIANTGNYLDAIGIAQQISRGRVLHKEASQKIWQWQQEIQAERMLQKAYLLARDRTPESLAEAIRIAGQVPSSTEVGYQSKQGINRWSTQLLAIAMRASNYSLKEAIQIASAIPSGSDAYDAATSQIAIWEERLKPPVIRLPPVTETNLLNSP